MCIRDSRRYSVWKKCGVPHTCRTNTLEKEEVPGSHIGLISDVGFCKSAGTPRNLFRSKTGPRLPRTGNAGKPHAKGRLPARRLRLQELDLSLIHISEPTRLLSISYAVF